MIAKLNIPSIGAICVCALLAFTTEVRGQQNRLLLITGTSSTRVQQQAEKPSEDLSPETASEQSPPDPEQFSSRADDPLMDRSAQDKDSAMDRLKAMEDLDDLGDFDDEYDSDEPQARPVTQWSLKPMTSLRAGLGASSTKLPADQSFQLTARPLQSLATSEKLFAWAAPEIRYQPLLFEDVALERYGQTRGFYRQPVYSAAHFLKSAVLLPYNSFYDPVDSCDYPLGYCRPGDAVPCVKQRVMLRGPRR